MHGRGHADAGLDHAADHAFHPVHRGDVGDADGVGDAAGLHQLDVDDVGGAHLDQVDHLGRAEYAFVGHHRRVHAVGDVLQSVQVAGLHRLFQQFQHHPGVLQVLHGEHRLLGGPALVGVQAQQGAAFDRGVDGLHPLDVQADVLAHLDLQRFEAALHRADRVGHHLVDVVHADGDVGGDDRVAAAQHLVQRRVVQLRPQVVNRDLHRGLGAGVAFQRGLDEVGDAVEVGDVLAYQAGPDELAHRFDDGAVRVAGDDRRRRRFAIADVAGVRVHDHHDVLHRVHRAQGGLERCLQRHAQHAEPDVGDLHGAPWGRMRWMAVMRSTVDCSLLNSKGSSGVTATELSLVRTVLPSAPR